MVAETSDAAYEKRHRKFENFEKRQRLREKEKLKHEHYKLKERIEQLKAMDGSTFMTLPSSAFTPPPRDIAEDIEETPNSPYVSLIGGVSLVEGERRRKEMLDVAIMLEKRYAYLLPPRKLPEVSYSTLKDTEGREGEETDTERDSGVPASRNDKTPKLRNLSVKSSSSSAPVHSPASSRPIVSRKSLLALIPELKQPNRIYRASISTSAETLDLTLVDGKEESSSSLIVVENEGLASQLVQYEKSPSPIIAVDDIPETDRLPSQPPSTPTPVPSVRDERSPSPRLVAVDDIPEDDRLPSPSPPLTPSQSVHNAKSPSPHTIVVDEIPESEKLPTQSPPPMPFQLVQNDPGTHDINSPEAPVENQISLTEQNDTQLEDVSMEISDDGLEVDTIIDVEVPQPQPEPSMQHMENLIPADGDGEEASLAAENVQEPTLERGGQLPDKGVDTEEVEAATTMEPVSTGELEQPRKRRRKWGRRKALLPRKRGVRPLQAGMGMGIPHQRVAGPSRVVEDESEVVSGIRLEEIPTEVGRDPMSARPAKRLRRSEEEMQEEPESISAAPIFNFDREISATALSIRGKTHVSYVDSRTKEKICTPSLLLVACMRAVEKTKYRRARETISFGGPTPDFGKGAIVDYELLEEILYRDIRDKSLEDESEEEDSSDEDDGAEELRTETEDETEDETEEETESVYRQPPEAQLSGERDRRIENETSSPEIPLEPVEPQSGREENHHGVKLKEQGHHSNGLVFQGPSEEQLVASPEAEPMPELPPGVRPREPSRRHDHHCDWDEEELLWNSDSE